MLRNSYHSHNYTFFLDATSMHIGPRTFYQNNCPCMISISYADLGLNLDSKSADKELKAVTPEKSKACVTALTN